MKRLALGCTAVLIAVSGSVAGADQGERLKPTETGQARSPTTGGTPANRRAVEPDEKSGQEQPGRIGGTSLDAAADLDVLRLKARPADQNPTTTTRSSAVPALHSQGVTRQSEAAYPRCSANVVDRCTQPRARLRP